MTRIETPRIFLSPPHMSGRELELVQEAFDSNYIAPVGPMVDAFERAFAEYSGIPHCLALASGTAATHLALRHLIQESGVRSQESAGNGARPLVLASTLTFIGSVTPATFEGCELRFIDCDRATWNMDVGLLAEELAACEKEGRRPAAVIPTDLYGQCCDLPRIVEICARYAVPVICDSAEAVGARYVERDEGGNPEASPGRERLEAERNARGGRRDGDGSNIEHPTSNIQRPRRETSDLRPPTSDLRHSGFAAWASVFSFNGNKIITTSGGGMLASHDKALIDHARKLATQARDPVPHYQHSEIGFNYRMSNILAAIGRGQLQVLDERVRRKREIFAAYQALLGNLPGIMFMPEPEWSRSNRWLTVILIDPKEFGADTHAVREALERENIEARPVWMPMHLQPVFEGCRIRGGAVSEELFARGLCLPSGTAMSDQDIRRVCDVVESADMCTGCRITYIPL